MKTFISYVPHGISQTEFYPIDELHPQYQDLYEYRSKLLKGKEYDFVLLFNSRNIQRKAIPNTLLAFKTFIDTLPQEQAKKCCIVLHTQPVDNNGTDLYAVREMLFGETAEHHVIFSDQRVDTNKMNLLYNSADGVILLSSNEGWGLSVTEALMAGKPIIINVTGGMQDQARFEDEEGNWLEMNEKFSTNHLGRYKTCGKWAFPVFPSNISIQGSPQTPYITDNRCSYYDAYLAIRKLYECSPEERKERGLAGREWVTSDESQMSADNMCKNIVKSIDTAFAKWEPREPYEVIKVKPRKKKHVQFPISY